MSSVSDELRSSILDFQANEVRFILRRKLEPVDAMESMDHFNSLRQIWQTSKLEDERIGDEIFKWRKLGFDTEDIGQEFGNVGVLGLDCLVRSNPPPSTQHHDSHINAACQKHFIDNDPEAFVEVIIRFLPHISYTD